MSFYADLHIHSKYSRACSRDCDLEQLAWWAGRKGVTVVGTGDFTHPAWLAELESTLVPAEPGVFRLRPDLERDVAERLPPACRGPVRFLLSVEISTIYKRDDRTRKVHHLVYAPDFDTVHTFNRALGRIGNLGSDGRPILGLDSRDLLEITLESGPGAYLVPAHVWTPWFAVLGSMSGFDAVADCYADLADHVFAVETGLSSDPEMNWRVSGLDRYRLVSNSDAHSPPMLGREATVFDCAPDYPSIRHALETGDGFCGTVEFFPEEGKYHLDGHRKCGVRLEPAQTRDRSGRCPGCGKPLTVGVLHRVEALADRPHGTPPPAAAPFRSLVQLPQIVGEILGVGARSKRVAAAIGGLVAQLGPELGILESVPLDDLRRAASPLLVEAIARLRRGEVSREAGYDGEYGVIRLFAPEELRGAVLMSLDEPELPAAEPDPLPLPVEDPAPVAALATGLDPEQHAAATAGPGPLLVVAGPGTGKTRTLTHRIAHLVGERGVVPEHCLAITFTRRAREELQERLDALVPGAAARVTVATFHGLGLSILRERDPAVRVADEVERLERSEAQRVPSPELTREQLHERGLVDLDDLVALPVAALEADPVLREAYRARWTHVFVDEYQDVDELQYRLLRCLVPPDGDLCAIGDPDQAIYGFRGGDVAFFLRFRADFPSARTVSLTRNYRSSPAVVDSALAVIAPGSLVPGRALTAAAPLVAPPSIVVHGAASERAEAEFVVASIERLLGGSSHFSIDSGRAGSGAPSAALSFADFAVLARTDAQMAPLAEALDRSGMPFQRRSHDRLLDRPAVAAAVARLRAAAAVGVPVLDQVRAVAEEDAVVDLLAPLAQRAGCDLGRFLTELALGAEVDTWDPRADRVSLLTLHASKGLEFPVVFVVGCEDGLLPLRWGNRVDIAEERRLLFVGMTRARTHLHLSHAHRRLRHGQVRDAIPSPFLADLPTALVERLAAPSSRARRPEQVAEQLQLI